MSGQHMTLKLLPILFCFIYSLKQIYILYDIEQGSIAIAGAAVKWLRDNLGLIKDASELGIVPFLFAFFFSSYCFLVFLSFILFVFIYLFF